MDPTDLRPPSSIQPTSTPKGHQIAAVRRSSLGHLCRRSLPAPSIWIGLRLARTTLRTSRSQVHLLCRRALPSQQGHRHPYRASPTPSHTTRRSLRPRSSINVLLRTICLLQQAWCRTSQGHRRCTWPSGGRLRKVSFPSKRRRKAYLCLRSALPGLAPEPIRFRSGSKSRVFRSAACAPIAGVVQ
jgi:hypothetical protein